MNSACIRRMSGRTSSWSCWTSCRHRKPGNAKVDLVDQGGSGRDGRSALRIVTDDMPFLVDSVNIVLGRAQLEVRVLQHPIVKVVAMPRAS